MRFPLCRLASLLSLLLCSLLVLGRPEKLKEKGKAKGRHRLRHTDGISEGLIQALAAHHQNVCDGDKLVLKCPPRTAILVERSFYGRLVSSTELCPNPVEGKGKKKKPKVPQDHYEDLSCDVSNAHLKIKDACQDKRKCKIQASPQFFQQDPCPTTSKYLQVAYRCVPSQFNSESFCEGEDMKLDCPPKSRLAVHSATYGWSKETVPPNCQSKSAAAKACLGNSMDVIGPLCQAKTSCSLMVDRYQFPHTCAPNVQTYLNIVFSCVKEEVFSELFRSDTDMVPPPTSRVDLPKTQLVPTSTSPVLITEAPHSLFNSEEIEETTRDFATTVNAMNDGAFAPPKLNEFESPSSSFTPSFDLEVTLSPRPLPATCYPPGIPNAVGISVQNWLVTVEYVKAHKEKFILYFCLSASVGLIILLAMCIVQQCILRFGEHKNHYRKGMKTDDTSSHTVTVFEDSRVEMPDFARDGMFTRFNHPTPPRTSSVQQFYSS